MFQLKHIVLAVPFLVAACTSGSGPSLSFAPGLSKGSAPKSVAVAKGAIVVAGPQDYCVDKRGSRLGGGTAFVLLASCANLSRDATEFHPTNHALLTASVEKQNGESPAAADLLTLVNSTAGRAALARDGRAESVSVVTAVQDGDSVLMQINDQSDGAAPGLESTYWRGLFTLNGRLITTTVVGFKARPLPSDNGLAMLKAFEQRIRSASPKIDVSELSTPPKSSRNNLFRNLLR